MNKGILINQQMISARPTGISRVAIELMSEIDKNKGKLFFINSKGNLYQVDSKFLLNYMQQRVFPKVTLKKNKIIVYLRPIILRVFRPKLALSKISELYDWILNRRTEKILKPYLLPLQKFSGSILLPEPLLNKTMLNGVKQYSANNPETKITIVCHDLISITNQFWFTKLAGIKNKLVVENYLLANEIVCVSKHTFETCLDYFKRQPEVLKKVVGYIPLGSPLEIGEKLPKIKNSHGKKINVLYVSSINPRKNHTVVAELLSEIASTDIPIDLQLISGDSWNEKSILMNLSSTIHEHFHISIFEKVSESELIARYREADFSVYLSLDEGFGLPVLEALSQGCPVICSDSSSMRYFETLPGVITVNPLDRKAIKTILSNMILDKNFRNNLRNLVDPKSIRKLNDFAKEIIEYV